MSELPLTCVSVLCHPSALVRFRMPSHSLSIPRQRLEEGGRIGQVLRRKKEPHSLKSEKMLAEHRSSSLQGCHGTQEVHFIELETEGSLKVHSFIHSFICSCVCISVCIGQKTLYRMCSELSPMVHGIIFTGLSLRTSRSLSWVTEFLMFVPLMRNKIQTRDKCLREISWKSKKSMGDYSNIHGPVTRNE